MHCCDSELQESFLAKQWTEFLADKADLMSLWARGNDEMEYLVADWRERWHLICERAIIKGGVS